MKKAVAALVFLCLFGCATITVNPDTGEVKYTRIGDQQISGLNVGKTKTGINVSLEGQQSDGTALLEAIKVLGQR